MIHVPRGTTLFLGRTQRVKVKGKKRRMICRGLRSHARLFNLALAESNHEIFCRRAIHYILKHFPRPLSILIKSSQPDFNPVPRGFHVPDDSRGSIQYGTDRRSQLQKRNRWKKQVTGGKVTVMILISESLDRNWRARGERVISIDDKTKSFKQRRRLSCHQLREDQSPP